MAQASHTPAAVTAQLTRALGSGNINLANQQLLHWPKALFDPSLIADKDKWWEVCPAQKLDLCGNQLQDIPDEIAVLTDLAVLLARHNCITHISSCIGQLTQLHTLDLSRWAWRSLASLLDAKTYPGLCAVTACPRLLQQSVHVSG
jgi:hypothetical protein